MDHARLVVLGRHRDALHHVAGRRRKDFRAAKAGAEISDIRRRLEIHAGAADADRGGGCDQRAARAARERRAERAGDEAHEIDERLLRLRGIEAQAAVGPQEIGVGADAEPHASVGAGADRLPGLQCVLAREREVVQRHAADELPHDAERRLRRGG